STSARWGSSSGVGDHSLSSSLESAGVDAVVALGKGCAHAGSSGTSPPRVIGRGDFRLAGQLVTVGRQPRALVAFRRTRIRLSPLRPALERTLRRPTIVLTLRRSMIARVLRRSAIVLGAILSRAMFGLKLAAGALAVAMVALAIMNYRDAEPAAT